MAEVRKLIDRADVIEDLHRNVTPIYFPTNTLDENRTSGYAWLVEAVAKGIEDTASLEQTRAANYVPELSNSEIHVNQTAKLRGIGVARATPGRTFAFIAVLKDDIIEKGTPANNGTEMQLLLDRRSTILYGKVNYSLPDDIILRAVRRGNRYIFAANYVGNHTEYDSYLQTYEYKNSEGEELLAMVVRLYQYECTVISKHVTDSVEFLYDGLYFDYSDKLAGFDVFYRRSSADSWHRVPVKHYLSTERFTNGLYYNDDESGMLRILNNPYLGIGVNAEIRVEMRTTLGADGNIQASDTDETTFSMYQDSEYNYTGVHVFIGVLAETTMGKDGDTIADIKANLINMKTRRDNITTEHDIITYINDADANVQPIKSRNDIQDRLYMLYTLVRYGDDRRIAPTTTKRLLIDGIRADGSLGDFDYYDPTIDRKLIYAYSRFKLHVVDGEPDQDYVTKCPADQREISVHSVDEMFALTPDDVHAGDIVRLYSVVAGEQISDTYEVIDEGALDNWSGYEKAYYLTCPFLIMIDDLEMCYYYFNSVNQKVVVQPENYASLFPYQAICQNVYIYRDSHDPETHNLYTFSVYASLNTENDELLVDPDTGSVIDVSGMVAHLVFYRDNDAVAYLPMYIAEYNAENRQFLFAGSVETNDFITETNKLQITGGMKRISSEEDFNGAIDFKDATFRLVFMFKQDDAEGLYGRDADVYSLLPSLYTNGYVWMNSFKNPNSPYGLLIEYNKFSRSSTNITDATGVDMLTDALQKTIGNTKRWKRTEAILRASKNDEAAVIGLMAMYGITRRQAEAVINTKLRIFEIDNLEPYKIDEEPDDPPGGNAKYYITGKNEAIRLDSAAEKRVMFEDLDGGGPDPYVTLKRLYIDDDPLYTEDEVDSEPDEDDDDPSPPSYVDPGVPEYLYEISAVPFFEYLFGIENTAKLYSTFENMATVYGGLMKLTTDFEVSLKFIATYGASKNVLLRGGRDDAGNEIDVQLHDLNPTMYFKIYGAEAPVDEIYDFIYKYMRDNYIIDGDVFMSNVCTAVENSFPSVRSIKFMGINAFDASWQHILYETPKFTSRDIVTRYIPEQLNIINIQFELDES